MRVALLTTGRGALPYYCIETLLKQKALYAVVVSRKSKPRIPFAQKLRQVGLWYSLQHTFVLAANRLKGYELKENDLGALSIPSISWKKKTEEDNIINFLKENHIDVVITCGFQYILTGYFLSRFSYCINIHPACLPQYRGPEPMTWGLLNNEKHFGLTLHLVDSGIDTGDILFQKTVNKPLLPLLFCVENKLAKALPDLLEHFLTDAAAKCIKAHPQPKEGSYLPTPTLENRKRYRATQRI